MISTKGVAALANMEDLIAQPQAVVNAATGTGDAVIIQDAGVVVITQALYNKLMGIRATKSASSGSGRRGRPRKNPAPTDE